MIKRYLTKDMSVGIKYTNGGLSKGEVAGCHRYHGWLNEGIECFNNLFDLNKADKSVPFAKLYKEFFQVFCKFSIISGKVRKIVQPIMPTV